MGIKDMLLRENFYKILRETIIKYARAVLGKEVKCQYEPFEDAESWSVNTVLGFVARIPTPKGVRSYMKSEYNVRSSCLKNLIGKLGVNVICTLPCIGTAKKLYISKGIFSKDVFIVPQNRSIRFYDYEKMTVDCIVKAGFTSKYFDNQAKFRAEHQNDFLNPMLAHGDGWFREPVLTGHPLVRTTDEKLFQKGTEESLQYLKQIAEDSLEYVPAELYIATLKEDAVSKIHLAVEKKDVREADAALQLVDVACGLASELTGDIPTCNSHGDFQSGNIWVEPSGKTLIYDWETAGRRSVWYDSATLFYSLRRVYGWASMMEDNVGKGLTLCVPEGQSVAFNVKAIRGIILLEDMIFYLDDMLELPEDWGGDEFDAFVANVKILNWK